MGEACLPVTTGAIAFQAIANSSAVQQDVPWYALKVRTGSEPMAVAVLRDRGVGPYCPMQQERRRYSDRMKLVNVPVFPGYVFCQFDMRQKLAVISSPGVEYIVGFAGEPAPISEEEVINIRRMIAAGATVTRSLARGQKVRVTHGPLEGIEGTLVRDSTGDRLVVSIELLNQGAFLHIDQHDVCPIGQS